MGWRVSWIGVHGRVKAELLEQLGFLETDESDPLALADFSCAETQVGWVVILSPQEDWATPQRIAELSAGAVAVGCQMSENTMYSQAWGFKDGRQQWSVLHYLDEGHELTVEGTPPPEFAEIRDRAQQEQDKDSRPDYIFEVPVDLTAALCGFRPGDEPADSRFAFKVIKTAASLNAAPAPKSSGWFGKLFSRGR